MQSLSRADGSNFTNWMDQSRRIVHGDTDRPAHRSAQAAHQFCLVRCFSTVLQASSASVNILKGDPPILIAPRH
jgi:hypothetical protein